MERSSTGALVHNSDRGRGYCQVDEKLADRPPRYWARARREPTMLGIRNGRQPQLDSTMPDYERRREELRQCGTGLAW